MKIPFPPLYITEGGSKRTQM